MTDVTTNSKALMKNKTKQASYDDKMKAKGLIKSCIWISPNDFDKITNEGRLSRKRHDKLK